MIPVGIKIFKLIVNEFANELEKDELAEDDDDEDDEVAVLHFDNASYSYDVKYDRILHSMIKRNIR